MRQQKTRRPARKPAYIVCPNCQGEGKVVNPAVSTWTSSDIDRDPEGFQSMMAGDYDILCPMCHGDRVTTRRHAREYHQERADHFETLREQGIHPGHPDWF